MVSSMYQLCDVTMEEWKRIPVAACEALVNSMLKRVKAVLENNSGHTKYWPFGPNMDKFLKNYFIFYILLYYIYLTALVTSYF